jgi:EAL domain-containing protein (putative c-di-GMP-specific phosphodiesterase class I)/FixJ family two-component response regulator
MANKRILLVDDDTFLLNLLKQQLRNIGLENVSSYSRASDALAVLKEEADQFEIILCDLQMPDMDGIEFVRNIARIGHRAGLLLMSGESPRLLQTAESLATAHGLNVLGVLQKPVSSDRLRSVLASSCRGTTNSGGKSQASCTPSEICAAIAGKQLINHYQPKVEMKSRTIVGVESLVRWQHPDDGLIFPDRFVPVAEENGLIDQLTHQVLTNALRDARSWRRLGWNLSIAVNVSMRNLVSLDFPDIVVDLAQRVGIPTADVVLEVTESQLMIDPVASLDILTRLRLKQVRLSIDDFGMGYSSLAQLRDIPFDELKVDRSFVHGADRDPASMAIVDASFSMAKALGMTTVAEGVEDQADWDWLMQRGGCDIVQGFFLAKPMSAVDLTRWLAAVKWPGRDELPAQHEKSMRAANCARRDF